MATLNITRRVAALTLIYLVSAVEANAVEPALGSSQNLVEAKADVQRLVDAALPFAEQMLTQYQEFHPFGAHIGADGKIGDDGAYDGDEHPNPADLIELFERSFREDATHKGLRACVILYDVRVVPPGKKEKQDAIAAAVDHRAGLSLVVIYPYRFDANRQLQIEAPFTMKGAGRIFPKAPSLAP
jgi:hypothetical protein